MHVGRTRSKRLSDPGDSPCAYRRDIVESPCRLASHVHFAYCRKCAMPCHQSWRLYDVLALKLSIDPLPINDGMMRRLSQSESAMNVEEQVSGSATQRQLRQSAALQRRGSCRSVAVPLTRSATIVASSHHQAICPVVAERVHS